MGFLTPSTIVVSTDLDGPGPKNIRSGLRLVKGPPVVWVADQFLRSGSFKEGDFGYHFVGRRVTFRGGIYAWPLPLWALLKMGALLVGGFWYLLRHLYDHQLITVKTPEGSPIRLRDIRPTPWRR